MKSAANSSNPCDAKRALLGYWQHQVLLSIGLVFLVLCSQVYAAESRPLAIASSQVTDGVEVKREAISLFFATGDDRLPVGAVDVLEELIFLAKAGAHMEVTGFHDAVGSDQLNQALDLERAKAVRKLLLQQGVPADQIKISISSPAADAPRTNAEGRRVEIKLVRP